MTFEIPVKLKKRGTEQTASIAAWYLSSGEPRDWVAEIVDWSCDQSRLRFYPVPTSRVDTTPCGVVISMVNGEEFHPRISPKRGMALRRIAGKILAPVDSDLRFPLSDGEVRKLVPHDFLLLLPGDRKVAFSDEDGRALHELIAPFELSPTAWNDARIPLEPGPPRLRGIEVVQLLDFDQLMKMAREDIGDSNPDDLPNLPGESKLKNSLGDLASLPKRKFLEGIKRWAANRPATASKPTWVNHLESWAEKNLGGIAPGQNRQLDRLLELLRKDPDKGLKYALPLTGDPGRGVANSGGSLGLQNVGFNLGALFGSSGAIGSWMVGNDRYWELQKSYREAANRELALKRYRRAAYIFGQLLGDVNAAANALEQGGHFREAAIIYEKKLNMPEKAAECYRKSGIFEEALRLFREQKKFEAAGDMLAELGREDEATKAFEEALDFHLMQDQRIEACRIARKKLTDDDRGLEILRDAWPDSAENEACLRLEFQMLAERKAHEDAALRIDRLAKGAWSESSARIVLNQFVRLKQNYPEAEITNLAADSARKMVGNRLINIPTVDRSLIQTLPRISGGDALMHRDAMRFSKDKINLPKPKLPAAGMSGDESVSLVKVDEREHFPAGSVAFAACAFDGGVAILKRTQDRKLDVVFMPSEGLVSRYSWDLPRKISPANLKDLRLFPIRARKQTDDRSILISGRNAKHFPLQKHETSYSVEIGYDENFGDDVIAAASTSSGQTWTFRTSNPIDNTLECSFRGDIGAIFSPQDLGQSLLGAVELVGSLQMKCWRSEVFMACSYLAFRFKNGTLEHASFENEFQDIAVSESTSKPIAAYGSKWGVILFTPKDSEKLEDSWVKLASDLENTRVAFTASRHLVVAAAGIVQVFAIDKKGDARLTSTLAIRGMKEPLCVAPGAKSDEFSVVTVDKIWTFQLRK